MWEEEQREQLYANILSGGVSAMSLPVSLYEDIAKTLYELGVDTIEA